MIVSKHKKQVLLLYATTALGVIVGVLSSVINTRALSPDLYGNVRYVQNVISFISSLLLVGYFVSGSRLLALSKNEEESKRIRGILCIILAITICIVMVCMSIMYFYTKLQGDNSTMQNLYLLAIPLCGTALMLNYLNTTAQGDNHIGRISAARLLPSLLYVIFAYFIYQSWKASSELMLLLNNGIATIVLFVIILSTRPSFKGLIHSFTTLNKENKSYGFNIYLGSLAGVSTGYVAGITLGMFCESNANVGFYTLAQTISAPLAMLPATIGTTYYKQFAGENRIANNILCYSIGITILSCLVFKYLIKYVVIFLYNEDYFCVSSYASWLVLGTCMQGLGDMFNRFLGAHGLGKQIRNGAFASGGILLLGSIILVKYYQINGAIVTRILYSFVYLFFMIYYYIQFVNKKKEKS